MVVVTWTPPGGAIVLTTIGPTMPRIGLAGVVGATEDGRATTVIVYLRSADSETSEQWRATTMAAARRIMKVSSIPGRRAAVELDRAIDHSAGRSREGVWLECADIGDHRVLYIIARSEGSAAWQAEIVDDYNVVSDFSVRIDIYVIDCFDHRTDIDDESGLLQHLARHCVAECLSQLDATARQAPATAERLLRSTYEHHRAFGHQHDGANPDDWGGRITTRGSSHRMSSDAWALKSNVEVLPSSIRRKPAAAIMAALSVERANRGT